MPKSRNTKPIISNNNNTTIKEIKENDFISDVENRVHINNLYTEESIKGLKECKNAQYQLSHHHKITNKVFISNLKKFVLEGIENRDYENSLVWIEQLYHLTKENDDMYTYSLILFNLKRYRQSFDFLKTLLGVSKEKKYLLLSVQCLIELNKLEEAFEFLNSHKDSLATEAPLKSIQRCQEMAQLLTIYGNLAYKLGYDERALNAFIKAIYHDICQVKAFESIIQYQLLNLKEEIKLIHDLPFSQAGLLSNYLKNLYISKLNKVHTEISIKEALEIIKTEYKLSTSSQYKYHLSELYYYQYQYKASFEILQSLYTSNPNEFNYIPLYLSLCYELSQAKELYSLSQFLILNHPLHYLTWLSIGSFYLVKKKFEEARRFFARAITFESNKAEVWLSYGHAFSGLGEHDQAISAYKNATALIRSSPYPYLCIAMQYTDLKNDKLAHEYLMKSTELAPEDPLILNELGLLYYREKRYELALSTMKKALEIGYKIPLDDCFLSSICYNYVIILLKLGELKEALKYIQTCSKMMPNCSKVLLATGILFHLMLDFANAIHYYTKCNQINPNHVADDLLKMALNFISLDNLSMPL